MLSSVSFQMLQQLCFPKQKHFGKKEAPVCTCTNPCNVWLKKTGAQCLHSVTVGHFGDSICRELSFINIWAAERGSILLVFSIQLRLFFLCHGTEIWQGGASLEWDAAWKLKSAGDTHSVFTFSFIDTELGLNDHPPLTPPSLVGNAGPLVNVHCVMWHAPSSPEAMQAKFWAQAPELFPLKSLKFCHWWFTLSIISLKWLSYFSPFFESLPNTQAGISAVCSVILSSTMLFGKTENKTKWINLQIKK